jgi:transcription elongation factor Elf1
MAQTLCIKCGSELKVSSYCNLCQEPLIFACTSCEYITEEKVHTDCRNAEVLAKTAEAKEEGEEAVAATTTTTASRPTSNRNQEEAIVDKHKEEEEETVKAEPRSAPSYMTTKQDNKNFNNVNPFVAGTAIWQSLMTYWFNAYGEFLKSAPKMTEDWYNIFWKPWLNWAQRQQQQVQDKVE